MDPIRRSVTAGSVMDIDTLDDLLQAREVLRTIDHLRIPAIADSDSILMADTVPR
jgi:hypothetical protein